MDLSAEHLKSLVEHALPIDAKPGENVLMAAVTAEGARVVAQLTFEHGWAVKGITEVNWKVGNLEVGATILKRW